MFDSRRIFGSGKRGKEAPEKQEKEGASRGRNVVILRHQVYIDRRKSRGILGLTISSNFCKYEIWKMRARSKANGVRTKYADMFRRMGTEPRGDALGSLWERGCGELCNCDVVGASEGGLVSGNSKEVEISNSTLSHHLRQD